jgi:hypothetical protein
MRWGASGFMPWRERFPKSGDRFSDKKRDKIKSAQCLARKKNVEAQPSVTATKTVNKP